MPRHQPGRERIGYPDNMCFGMVLSVEDDNLAMICEWKARGMKHFKLRPNDSAGRDPARGAISGRFWYILEDSGI